MKNKAFTLIELLAVIVVLGIIMLIAITSVTNVMRDSKDKAYNAQIKLIENAARTYHVSNTLTFINNQSIVTLKDLQDYGYINQNIKNAKTGEVIPDTSWVIITKNSDKYEYNYGYIADGLVLHYDGIYNGGVNIHNDNTSTNKGTWKDLSGNNNDGTLSNFNYTSTSGWKSTSLQYGKTADSVTSLNPLSSQTTSLQQYTLNMLIKVPSSTSYTELPRINGINNGIFVLYTSANTSLHYINSGANDYYTYSSSVVPRDVYVLLTFRFNKDSSKNLMKVQILKNAVDFSAQNFPENQNKVPAGMDINLSYLFSTVEVFNIQIYNRVLTDDEVLQNYNLDKIRYSIP